MVELYINLRVNAQAGFPLTIGGNDLIDRLTERHDLATGTPLDSSPRNEYTFITLTPHRGGRGISMDDTQRTAVLKRLRSISGHVSGIERMVTEDSYCIDVIKQIQAVQAALNKVNDLILEGHLNTCVIEAVRGDNQKERERVLNEIVGVFEMAQKL